MRSKVRISFTVSVLACLFAVSQPLVRAKELSVEDANLFNQLMQDGRNDLNSNKNDSALEKFEKAKTIVPDSAAVYINLGMALGRKGDYDEAIPTVKHAIQLSPSTAVAWLDLASLYQSSGQIPQAIDAFNDYLKRFPNDAAANDARNIVAILKKNQNGVDSPESSDYYAAQEKVGIQKWDLSKMPLRVFVEEGSSSVGYKPEFRQPVLDAFTNWENKTKPLVSFKFVNSAQDADIFVRWINDPKLLVSPGEAADCRRDLDAKGIKHATVSLLTSVPASSGMPFNSGFIRWVSMHEIGHALGLAAHSMNSHDIMYATMTFDIDKKDISARDVATLKRMYETVVTSEGSPIDLYNAAVDEIGKQNRQPLESQDFLPAIQKLENIRTLFPKFDNVLAPLGYAYCMYANHFLREAKLAEAEEYYKKSMATLPKGANPGVEEMLKHNYGTLLKRQHKDDEATKLTR